jgi:hypothetical protein
VSESSGDFVGISGASSGFLCVVTSGGMLRVAANPCRMHIGCE